MPARLMSVQMAQKSPECPIGIFCGDDGATPAETSLFSAAAHAAEPPPNMPTCTWPNASKNWQANAKNASQVTTLRFDRNQPMVATHALDRWRVTSQKISNRS